MSDIAPPAPRPCDSCPYRRDVPSGVWASHEYEKLRAYDRPTGHQPPGVFLCHQTPDSDQHRLCAGWVGCHPSGELLALRLAAMTEQISASTYEAALEYTTPVPLFDSGAEAADHGQQEILTPGESAVHAISKLTRSREAKRGHGPGKTEGATP